MDLLAITAQVFVLNGTAQEVEAVPGLLAQPAPTKAARGRERDFLFAHLTLSGPLEETAELARELVQQLGSDFFQSSGSVTASLRRAVINTNERLLRHNLTAKPSPGDTTINPEGALTCAALHGDELYTLQVGEGLAFLGHNFGVERLPVQPPRHLTPLGRSAGIDIRFAYHRLQSGDMMLLADPRMAYLTGTMLTPVLVNTEIETGFDSLMSLVANDTARLILIEFADELPSTLPLSFSTSKSSGGLRKPIPGGASKKSKQQVSQQPAPAAVPVAAGPVISPPTTYEPSEVTIEQAELVPPTAGLAVETSARRVASSSARGLSRVVAWLATFLGMFTNPSEPAKSETTPINWAIPTAIALLVPLVLAAVVTGVYFRRGNIEQLAAIKQEMVYAMALAEESDLDQAETRLRYGTVLQLADEAEALRPADPEVMRMRAQALDALDRIDDVTRLSAAPFYRYNQGVNLTRIILPGESGGLVVMDQSAGRVQLHPTDRGLLNQTSEQPTTIAFTSQAVGSQVIGPLVDILWLPSGAGSPRNNIATLDRNGGLFSYYPNLGDMRGLVLDNSASWLTPTVMNTFSNRLYILDPGAEKIWKYYPSETGFTQQAEDPIIFFSAEMGLDQAVDFDIYSEDGSIVVVYRDGRIRYYDSRSGQIQWDETNLLEGGLTTPFTAPVAVDITGRGLTASIFVLDPGTNRLVQLSRGGAVLAQYRILDAAGNDIIGKASDFVVLDAPLRVFVVAQEAIYEATRE